MKTLGKDVDHTEKVLQACLGDDIKLTQSEWDAYISLAYNVGAKAVCKSSIKWKLQTGRYQAACAAILSFDKVRVNGKLVKNKGLVNRREKEYRICMKGQE